eukprot:scaffold66582_cov38-Cyclotella_meneghiniana.AAC.1
MNVLALGRIHNNKLLKLERGSFGAIRWRYGGGFELETCIRWIDLDGAILDGDREDDEMEMDANEPRNHTWDYFIVAMITMAVMMGFRLAMAVSGLIQ